MNCTEASYDRLGSCKAPCYIAWGHENRSAFIRVPATTNADASRIEIRTPDSECNVYLVFTLLIHAALDGIKNNLEPPEPITENLFDKSHGPSTPLRDLRLKSLPDTLDSAREIAEQSSFIKDALGF